MGCLVMGNQVLGYENHFDDPEAVFTPSTNLCMEMVEQRMHEVPFKSAGLCLGRE